jgi:hypothetical protein
VSTSEHSLTSPTLTCFGSHVEYQRFLFDHILDVLLRHWDVSMRELGSQSLRFICLHDMSILAPLAIEKSVSNFFFEVIKYLNSIIGPSSRIL